jgi:DNA-binding response OmpR family regulator
MVDPPQLILLDIMMPRMDGLTALRRIRAHGTTGNTSIILLTARGLPEDRVRGLELGADDYITKPFDIGELVARVKAVLRRTQAARDLSPLTGLPGNFRIGQEIEQAVERGGKQSCRPDWVTDQEKLCYMLETPSIRWYQICHTRM